MEQIIQRLARARINEQAVNTERTYFYKTDRKVNPHQENPFKVFSGHIPMLISAPHAVRYIHEKKIRKSDEYTGSTAFMLNQLTGCYSLTVAKLYGGDPNADRRCPYKHLLASLCRDHKISLVLDLHGAPRNHPYDIELSCMGGQAVLGKTQVLNLLAENFAAAGLSGIFLNHSPVIDSNSVTCFSSGQLGIPAVQVNINRKYRVPAQNPKDFTRMLAGLTRCVNLLAGQL